MNIMPIVDLKISSASSPVSRSQLSAQAQEGADFSKTFQESLNAISGEDQPTVNTDKPVEKKQVKADGKRERELSEDSQDGQNVPPSAAFVPASFAGMVSLAAPEPVRVETALQSVAALDGAASALLAMDKTVLAQTMAVASNAGAQGSVMQGELKPPVMTNFPARGNQGATEPTSAQGALSAGLANQATPALAGVRVASPADMSGQGMPVPAGAVAAAQTKVVADDGATANQALLQLQQISQSVAVPVPKQTPELSLAQVGAMEKPIEVKVGVAPDISTGGELGSADLSTQSAAGPAFSNKAQVGTVFAPVTNSGGVAAEYSAEPPLVLDPRLSLPVAKDELANSVDDVPVAAQPDDLVPLGGLGPTLSGNQMGVTGSVPALAAAPAAPAVMVPAAHLNHELVKFAGAGGGRAVMEIISPELGALKIDLSIDGKGVARMVVEASTSAARDQLEQGMRQLHDDFAGLGLSLNVDLRQGGGSAYQRDAATDAWGSGPRGVAPASADRLASVASAAGMVRAVDDKSRVHFYA